MIQSLHQLSPNCPQDCPCQIPKRRFHSRCVNPAWVINLLDSLRIDRAVLIGHSMGGAIITRAAERFPTRVTALVYLDGAIQFHSRDSIDALRPFYRPSPPAPNPPDTTLSGSLRRYREYGERYFYWRWSPALAADYVAKYYGLKGGLWGPESFRRDSLVQRYGRENPSDTLQTNYGRFRQPALAICALATPTTLYPWLTADSARWAVARSYADSILRPFQERECDAFRHQAQRGHTAMLESSHYLFLDRPQETVRLITDFLSSIH